MHGYGYVDQNTSNPFNFVIKHVFSSSQESSVLFFSFDYNFIRYFSHTLILLFLLQIPAPAMVTTLCAGLSHKNIMLINKVG